MSGMPWTAWDCETVARDIRWRIPMRIQMKVRIAMTSFALLIGAMLVPGTHSRTRA